MLSYPKHWVLCKLWFSLPVPPEPHCPELTGVANKPLIVRRIARNESLPINRLPVVPTDFVSPKTCERVTPKQPKPKLARFNSVLAGHIMLREIGSRSGLRGLGFRKALSPLTGKLVPLAQARLNSNTLFQSTCQINLQKSFSPCVSR